MPTTTKMGIVYPASTDLVKNGATAMGTISTTVDAKTGLVLISNTTFTGVASQSISNVFSSSFDNYRVIYRPTSNTTTHNAVLRFRTTTDNSSTNYWYTFQGINQSGGSTNDNGVNQTGIRLGELNGGASTYCFYMFDVIAPNLATQTKGFTYSLQMDNSTILGSKTGGFGDNTTTQYTGFSIIPSSSTTFAGVITVYGYNF